MDKDVKNQLNMLYELLEKQKETIDELSQNLLIMESKKEVKKIIEEDGGVEMTRLNLNIPLYIKQHLTKQAALTSIDQEEKISVTDYLCSLVKEDINKTK